MNEQRVVDLTHPLHSRMPYWPGAGYRPFSYRSINRLDRDGVAAGRLAMTDHMGTHIDAPSHFEPSPVSVDRIPAADLICQGVTVDISDRARADPGALLEPSDLEQWHAAHGDFPPRCVVLVRSGWDQYWSDPEKFRNANADGRMKFPAVSASAAALLAEDANVLGVGVDTLSADNGLAVGSPCHHAIHGAGKFILENVANLHELPPREFLVIIGALPIVRGTGAPARVLALLSR